MPRVKANVSLSSVVKIGKRRRDQPTYVGIQVIQLEDRGTIHILHVREPPHTLLTLPLTSAVHPRGTGKGIKTKPSPSSVHL